MAKSAIETLLSAMGVDLPKLQNEFKENFDQFVGALRALSHGQSQALAISRRNARMLEAICKELKIPYTDETSVTIIDQQPAPEVKAA